jgi:hypothetical protein
MATHPLQKHQRKQNSKEFEEEEICFWTSNLIKKPKRMIYL